MAPTKDSRMIEEQIKKLPREDMQAVCFHLLHRVKAMEATIETLGKKKEKISPVTETARV